MRTMNPIKVSSDIIDTYFRYLMTRFPLGKKDPAVREQLNELLYSVEGKQRLIRGSPSMRSESGSRKESPFRSKINPAMSPMFAIPRTKG